MVSDFVSALRTGVSSDPSLERPAGIEIRQDLEPAGGLPVEPPSYEGRLEIHKRFIDGEAVKAIELDSVGSAANRLEEALFELYRNGEYPLPVSDTTIPLPDGEPVTITTLEAPHRLFDAWLRRSAAEDGEGDFQDSEHGLELSRARMSALDPILETSAHDLLLGVWDSHRKGPHGQLRVPRSFTSTLIGLEPHEQARFAARRDPLNLGDASESKGGGKEKGARKKLSEEGLSSVPPQRSIPYEDDGNGRAKDFGGRVADHRGGVSISSARYLGFLSLSGLRHLGFGNYDPVEVRVLLATLGLYGVLLRAAAGWDLRARCSLVPAAPLSFNLVGPTGERQPLELGLAEVKQAFEEQVARVGITDRSVHLRAGSDLEKLVAENVTAATAA